MASKLLRPAPDHELLLLLHYSSSSSLESLHMPWQWWLFRVQHYMQQQLVLHDRMVQHPKCCCSPPVEEDTLDFRYPHFDPPT
jgi:hypothetical protein